jgi:carboxymethylenebutenolidase
MPDEIIRSAASDVPVYVAVPEGDGPWPGVVVVHDALGMTSDVRRQADWLASQGFLAVAPDLYHRGGRLRCMFVTMRAAVRGEGDAFGDLDATREWLTSRPDCTGKVGVIGFCMGGGYALLLSVGWGYDASSVNYGDVSKDADSFLADACPIVASYGAEDPTLRKAPGRLERALRLNGVEHDVEVYPEAGHSFLNDHPRSEMPPWALVMAKMSRSGYHEPSAVDARRRIAAFFHRHLAA